MQRSAFEVGVEDGAVLGDDRRILEGDRYAVGEADALDTDDLRAGLQPQFGDLLGACWTEPRGDESGAGHHPAPRHLLAERQEHAGPAVHRAAGDERAPPPLAIDEPGVGQLLDGLADRHPADVEAVAQLGLGRQRVTRMGAVDEVAQVPLDGPVPGRATGGGAR